MKVQRFDIEQTNPHSYQPLYEMVKRDDGEYVLHDDHAACVAPLVALRDSCDKAGLLDGDKLRTVLGTLPVTADGAIVGHDTVVFDAYPYSREPVSLQIWVPPITSKRPIYSTREAAEAAAKAAIEAHEA